MRIACVLVLGACVSSGDVTCPGTDLVCPEATVCTTVTVWSPPTATTSETEPRCVPPGDLATCAGQDDGASCDPAGVATDGECHSGACFAITCGNHLQEADEACDDGNEDFGDGCSVGCKSNELCGNGILDPVVVIGRVPETDEPILGPNELCDSNNSAPHDGCSILCRPEVPRWRERRLTVGPTSRFGARMVFDARNHDFVMFGGKSGAKSFDDTWVATIARCADGKPNCVTWTERTPAISPAPRLHQAMAFDGARGITLMFGGETGDTPQAASIAFRDTWAWDGATWTALASEGPAARRDAAMAYDPRRGKVVLYGGFTLDTSQAEILDAQQKDTWEWDGTKWKEIISTASPTPGPGLQAGHSMAYDAVRGVIVLVGASNGELVTWEWDGISWTQKLPEPPVTADKVPPARINASLMFDGSQLVLLGGQDLFGDDLEDQWRWNGAKWTAVQPTTLPPLRSDFAAALDPSTNLVLEAMGQHDSTAFDDTDVYDGTAWHARSQRTRPVPPGGLTSHTAAFDAVRGRLVTTFGNPAETWEFDGTNWLFRDVVTPTSRLNVMAYDEAEREVVFYGGPANDQTSVWNGDSWRTIANASQPGTRVAAAMAYDAFEHRTLLFGGFGTSTELWAWQDHAWTKLATGGPSARRSLVLGHDRTRHQLVLFGGLEPAGARGDTWVFDDTGWHEITVPVPFPAPRSGAAIAWNPARQALIMFGGRNATSELRDTWEWAGDRWIPLDVEVLLAPEARGDHVMTASRNGIYLLGGSTATDDLWELQFESAATPEDTCIDSRDWDGDGQRGCNDDDCRGTCAPLCTPVTGTDDLGRPNMVCMPDVSGPRCGDGVKDPLENCRSCPADFPEGCTPVCGDFVCDPGEVCLGDCP